MLVPVCTEIAIALRRKHPRSGVQKTPRTGVFLVLAFALLALSVGLYLVMTGPGSSSAWTQWSSVGIAFAFALLGFFFTYYYHAYSVTVSPDFITVRHPFRGTQTITHSNLLSVRISYLSRKILVVTYRGEDDEVRKISLDRGTFDFSAFFDPSINQQFLSYLGSLSSTHEESPKEEAHMTTKDEVTPPSVGDLFTIPVDDERVYVGQVIAYRRTLLPFIVVYDFVVPREDASARAPEAVRAPILLSGATFDSRFRPGMWTIVGSAEVHPEEILPAYRTGPRCRATISSFTESVERPAMEGEYDTILPDSVTSPYVFDLCLQAHEGLRDPLPGDGGSGLFGHWRTSYEIFGQL